MDKINNPLDAVNNMLDADLDQLTSNEEFTDLYATAAKVRSAAEGTGPVDTDAEWRRFVARQAKPKPFYAQLFHGRAAVVCGCVVATLAAVALTVGVTVSHNNKPAVETSGAAAVEAASAETSAGTDSLRRAAPPVPVVFKNQPLDSILGRMAAHYGVSSVKVSPEASALRLYYSWDPSMPVEDAIEGLNGFEQVKVTLSNNTLTAQ